MGEVSFRLESLDFRPGGSAWSLRRARDVRAVAVDVEWRGVVAGRVVAECDTVSFGSVATASAVTLTATLPPESVPALVALTGTSTPVELVAGEPLLRWAPGVDLIVRCEVVDDRVRFPVVAVLYLGRRVDVPSWVPSVVNVPADLPGGLRLQHVETDHDGVVVRAVLQSPPPVALDYRRVRALLAAR